MLGAGVIELTSVVRSESAAEPGAHGAKCVGGGGQAKRCITSKKPPRDSLEHICRL